MTGNRFGAVDVHYPEQGGATAALVVAADPTFGEQLDPEGRPGLGDALRRVDRLSRGDGSRPDRPPTSTITVCGGPDPRRGGPPHRKR